MGKSEKHPREKRTFWYTLAKGIFGFICLFFVPVKYHHLEYINSADAPFMLVANHSSMFDPPVLALAVKRYEIHFLGKQELNVNPILRYIFKKLHMISVVRHATDMSAMRASNNVLKSGHVLGIFPEGTRNTPENFMKGVESGLSMLVLRNQVPLMPAYIHGRIRFFHLNHVYFLPPIAYDDLLQKSIGKDAINELTRRYVTAITAAKDKADAELKKRTE